MTVEETRIGRRSFVGAELTRLRLIDVLVEGSWVHVRIEWSDRDFGAFQLSRL
jgi:hypothetical protein